MEKVLQIQSLSKDYGSLRAVDNLSLEIPKGNVFGILGPNGSGKTTTLGMVLGVTRPTSGEFKWFGGPLNFKAKKRIGALLETPNFYPYLSAEKNLSIVAQIKELKNANIMQALEMVDLHERASSKFKTYSLGMKQRLAIASALLSDPDVLVLDEPTNGLDPQGIAQIRSIINKIAATGITVILASHLLDEVEKVCQDVAVIRNGKLLYSGSVSEMTNQKGTIEISAEDNSVLLDILKNYKGISEVIEEDKSLKVIPSEDIDLAGLNKFLSEKGIYINHLVYRKNTLEEQFLEITKK